MHVGKTKSRSAHTYYMRDDDGAMRSLEETTVERDLGVLVSNDLKLGAQCKAAAAKANWKLGVFKKAFASRDPRLWELLWKTHIRPLLEHGMQAWSPYLEKDIAVLERVQQRVTKLISGLGKLTYTERLKKLGWTTLKERRTRGDLIFTYQHLKGNAEADLIWPLATPLTQLDGPAGGLRSNPTRLSPNIANTQQRENFLTSRVAAPLRDLPSDIMSFKHVNELKNAYDSNYLNR